MAIKKDHDEPEGQWCPDGGWALQHYHGGFGECSQGREDCTQEGARGGDACGKKDEAGVFSEDTHRGDQEDRPDHHDYYDYGTTVTSNLTPEELVKLVDVSVASKYGADLTQFTRIIADDMHNTLESFKTDLHNTLPRKVRSIVQQIQGEAQGKQPVGSPSTPYPGNTSAPGNIDTLYPGNTSAPGNMGTLYPGSTIARGNTGVLANTSTPHRGSTSANIIYVDARSMGNPGVFPTISILYPGGASTSGNLRLPAHVTQPNPGVSPNF
jgi:hypothetical protein